jgi:hypothetical protein
MVSFSRYFTVCITYQPPLVQHKQGAQWQCKIPPILPVTVLSLQYPMLYPQLVMIVKLLLQQENQAGTSLVVKEVTDEFITYCQQ